MCFHVSEIHKYHTGQQMQIVPEPPRSPRWVQSLMFMKQRHRVSAAKCCVHPSNNTFEKLYLITQRATVLHAIYHMRHHPPSSPARDLWSCTLYQPMSTLSLHVTVISPFKTSSLTAASFSCLPSFYIHTTCFTWGNLQRSSRAQTDNTVCIIVTV